MEKLKVALVQSNIVWEEIEENLKNYTVKLRDISNVDLIVLPEMFATGFSMNVDHIKQDENGSILAWMINTAKIKNCAVYGSLIFEDQGKLFNRAYLVKEDSTLEYYDKRHLFSLANEDLKFSRGRERKIFEYKGWRIFPQICYDLRFPTWSRNDLDYDLALYVANWPKKRIHAWQTLLKARAIENIAYVVGVNRVGEDGNNFEYTGKSALIDPLGEELSNFKDSEEKVDVFTLEKSKIDKIRKGLGFLNDKDDFDIKM